MDWITILTEIWNGIKNWYWLPLLLIYIAVIVMILVENGNPTKTIAWILVIVFLPVVGILIYFFFGQKFKKELYFKKLDRQQEKLIFEKWQNLSMDIQSNLTLIHPKIGDLNKVFNYLNSTFTSPPTMYNDVELLINGEQKFPRFLEAIEQAKDHIHLEYYIFENDQIGKEILGRLVKKAEEGVKVRVMIDDFGSPKLDIIQRRMIELGVEFQIFLPVRFSSLANSNFRNHRKILIVDGRIGFVGGINIADKYINNLPPYSDKNTQYWRDTSLILKGDSVNILQMYFWLNWSITDGDPFNLQDDNYINYAVKEEFQRQTMVSFGLTRPGEQTPSAMESMILGIMLAKETVQICTPYFIPSEQFKSALMIAVSAGVSVELILPAKGDSLIVQQASLSFLKPLMERGIKVFLYTKGFMHAKTITIDNALAYVGTVNLDNRSFFINFEITAVVQDDLVVQQLKEQFIIDKQNSYELTAADWLRTPIHQRAFASICRLLAPIL